MQKKSAEQSDAKENPRAIESGGASLVVPVIEEQIVIDKYVVETGKVRVSKRITEHEELIDEPIFHEKVNVQRIPINKIIDVAPEVRREDDTLIIPVVEERIFVQKRLVLVEELRIKKETVETHQPQNVTLLKEHVEIIRLADEKDSGEQSL